MTRLVRAELIKLRSTQVWFWLLLATLAVSVLLIVGQLTNNTPADYDTGSAAQLFASATNADVVVFVLGVLGVTTEFRYQTITPTFLYTPSRWAVVGAKLITYALVGIVYAALAVGLQLLTAVPWLSTSGANVDYGNTQVIHALIGVLAVTALYGIIGLGVGALVKNQIVGVVVGVIFLLVVENIFLLIPYVRDVWPYLPGGASAAVLHVSGSTEVGSVHLLPLWGGVLMLVAWAVVPAVVGASFTMTRDIT